MLETLLFVLGLNMAGFLVAFRFKTDKLTDISYALSFAAIAVYGALRNDMSSVQWIVFVLVMLWAARLGGFLLYRVQKVGKDSRFDKMRKNFVLFGRFWVLQAVTAWVVMLPATFLFRFGKDTDFYVISVIGALVALSGLLFEATADLQKFRFNQNKKNKGKWIESGVWKYSRHPNYFGEMVMWYGVWMACVPWLTDQQSYIGIISPLTITILLVGVSGIPILEKSADARWGKDKKYQDYKRSTSILVPWLKKK
jgi:steroid 5-alpha reductase family enzyme